MIDKLAWIHIKNNQILLARSKGEDTYYIPGGKREKDETDEDALIREIKEELTVKLQPNTIKFYERFQAQAHGKPGGTLVQMTCYFADYEGDFKVHAEIEEIYWASNANEVKCSLVATQIIESLQAAGHLERQDNSFTNPC